MIDKEAIIPSINVCPLCGLNDVRKGKTLNSRGEEVEYIQCLTWHCGLTFKVYPSIDDFFNEDCE